MYTDASALGLGAVLMKPDARCKNLAIAYASRTLTPAESNCSVTHQETLAVVWALEHFRDIILTLLLSPCLEIYLSEQWQESPLLLKTSLCMS